MIDEIEWRNERMKEWKNERMKEWRNEGMKEWKNERMKEQLSQLLISVDCERKREWEKVRMRLSVKVQSVKCGCGYIKKRCGYIGFDDTRCGYIE